MLRLYVHAMTICAGVTPFDAEIAAIRSTRPADQPMAARATEAHTDRFRQCVLLPSFNPPCKPFPID
ncbi:hypothetical protein DIE12_00020 [Burkholderia sp. Bp9015]|nr:hypothetical protein DIE20_35750 [Burkholderia sp. Bp9131]RQR79530.1 hypothetical protein DIE12_00020 [Burkholderia sp. Bp9015]